VPQGANCGEMVFTYDTEEQINLAYRTQINALRNGPIAKKGEEEGAGGIIGDWNEKDWLTVSSSLQPSSSARAKTRRSCW